MKDLGDLLSAAAFFTGGILLEVEHAKHAGLEHAAKLIEDEAKDELGNYQGAAGPYGAWPPLKPETVAHKTTGDSPLLETGELRDSISHKVEGDEAVIGSDLDIAIYQEMGTSKIPPRPFLGMAAIHKESEVIDVLGGHVVGAIAGQKVIGH